MRNIFSFSNARRKSEASFEAFVLPYMDHLYQLAYKFTGRKLDAEDLVQEVLIKIFGQWQDVMEMEKPKAWISRVTHFTYVDSCRRYARSPQSKSQSYDEREEDSDTSRSTVVLTSSDDTVFKVDNDLTGEVVEKALQQLSPERRSLVILHDIEGYTLSELADLLDSPLGTLKSRLHRARKQLRDILKITLKDSDILEPFSSVNRYY